MLIKNLWATTKLEIWQPKYHTESGDYEVWISKRKMTYASPNVIIEFTKAKHLIGQRFAVRRQDVERCPIGTNGKIQVYKVPWNLLESYETPEEVVATVNQLFEE